MKVLCEYCNIEMNELREGKIQVCPTCGKKGSVCGDIKKRVRIMIVVNLIENVDWSESHEEHSCDFMCVMKLPGYTDFIKMYCGDNWVNYTHTALNKRYDLTNIHVNTSCVFSNFYSVRKFSKPLGEKYPTVSIRVVGGKATIIADVYINKQDRKEINTAYNNYMRKIFEEKK